MSPLFDEEVLLDTLDSSLLIPPLIYETQEIPVLHVFRDGCGTITTQNSMENKVGVCGQKEGDVRKKCRDLCEVEGEISSEESESHGIPGFPDRVELAISSLVKREMVEDGNEELLDMPVVNPKPPSAWQDYSVLGLKEPADAVKHEVVDEGTPVQPRLLPHRPTPSNFVWKEQRCPSRKRVSPICDFDERKASRVGETQDKQLGQRETHYYKNEQRDL